MSCSRYVLSKTRSWGAITITGIVSSMSAIGPCLSSPAIMGTDVDQPRNLAKSVTVE